MKKLESPGVTHLAKSIPNLIIHRIAVNPTISYGGGKGCHTNIMTLTF
jgi:hypothetical protein